MANKKFWLGILVLVFGMTVVGCDNGDSSTPPPYVVGGGKKITITGITSTGTIMIVLTNESEEEPWGVAEISNGSATVDLLKEDDTPWTGSGSYYICMAIFEKEKSYLYTDGKTLSQLGITGMYDDNQITKLPKYNISGTVSTIAFNKFVEIN